MNIKTGIIFFFLALSNFLIAQDTIKIKKHADTDDSNCMLFLCVKKTCFTDSISKSYFESDTNIEVRFNDDCKAKVKSDVFVSSFELSANSQSSVAQSSFFTGPQKKIIQKLKTGDKFIIKNIVVHAPDGFKKMYDLQLILKK